ncbi:hypothetical protein E1287_07525 [Actinomadura sp. KC06]|uniref:aggregation-promoting factor C-terminal-like domain-containing protein n=1 Tax=Actinomadura sp. KC06 TaxID=2530369 RepID=UPI001042B7D3|nr:hypothetical protein E1287_07525 [Actinomadura sp. KC06]
MAEQDGGSVGIDVVPRISAAAWGQEIQRRLDPTVNRAGRALGRTLADGMKSGFAPRRLEEAMRDATPRLEVAAGRLGRRLGAQIARSVKAELELKLRNLPEANIRARVTIDPASLARVRQELGSLGPFNVTLNVDADTAAARAEIARLQAQVRLLSQSSVNINVTANTSRASRNLVILGAQMAALASIPLGAVLAAGIGSIAASATAAAAGIGGILAVAIPGVRRVSEALQAQKTADNQVAASTRGRTTALNAGTIATLQARQQATQMAQAERQVTQAQQAARQAQRDLNQARVDGARALQDMQNNLIGAGLSLRADEIAVQRAKQALNQLTSARQDSLAVQKAQADLARANTGLQLVLGDPNATQLAKNQAKLAADAAAAALKQARESQTAHELDRKEAQLAYEQAVHQLKQQRILVARLTADEAKARKAGVEGTQDVVAAKQRLRDALEQVADAQRNVRQQQIQDRIAALQQADAQRQAADAADGATAANVRLGRAMAALTPAEKELLNNWKAFSDVYRDWVKDLEPDVLPVLSGGLGLVATQLDRVKPLVRSSAAAFRILEARAAVALDGPFWTNFINNVGIAAPEAIQRFGGIAGNTLTGVAGVINAFLPFTNLLLGSVEDLTQEFEEWGTSLGGSEGFISFIQYVQQVGPQVVSTVGALGGALLDVGQALAPLAAIHLGALTILANTISKIANEYPTLIQFAAAALLVSKAIRVLAISSLVAGFTGTAAAAGVAGGAMLRFGVILRGLGAVMMGVSAQAATTRVALLGLSRAAGILLAFYAATEAINHFAGSAKDAKPSSDQLKQALIDLGRTGQTSTPLLKQFSDGLGDMNEQARILTDPTKSEQTAQFFSGLINGLYGANGIAGQAKENFKGIDTALVQLTQSGNADVAKAAFDRLSASLQANGRGVEEVNALFPTYTRQLYNGGGAANAFTAQIHRQNQALAANAQRFINSEQQIIDFNQALLAGSDALNRNGRAFWGNSRAATDNRQQVLNAARVLQNYTNDLVKNNQVTDGNLKRLRGQREQLIDLATKFTGSRKAAEKYVDQLVKIPKSAKTNVSVNAKGKFSMKGLDVFAKDPILGDIFNAGGGYIHGGGGPRDDRYLTHISAGEMVINAPATSRYLPLLTAINDEGNAGTIYKGRGYTSGPTLPAPTPAAGSDGAFAGGGLPSLRPRGQEALPAFAGGGLLKPSFSDTYHHQGDPPPTITKARQGNAQGFAGMMAYSTGQAAIGATFLTALLTGGYGKGAKAVRFAQAQLGEPYVWGATGPNSWDCSGLTMRAWEAAGVKIPRVTYDQIAYGTPTSRAKAMPGDLYFPHRGHVMMVTGMGGSRALVHAPRTGDVVRYAGWRTGGNFRHIAGGGGSWYGGGTPKGFAKAQLGDLGWSAAQFAPLNRLWERESNWKWNARNKSSGAYGIPQALPPGKMASFGSDWRTNWATQIRWGLDYIKRRYGSPARAWAHSQRTGWYADGTDHARRGWAWVGERGPELVNFRGGEAVYPHEESLRMAATAAAGPLELADPLPAAGGDEYHAHFDGITAAVLSREVRVAFKGMQMAQAQSLRIGRRG